MGKHAALVRQAHALAQQYPGGTGLLLESLVRASASLANAAGVLELVRRVDADARLAAAAEQGDAWTATGIHPPQTPPPPA